MSWFHRLFGASNDSGAWSDADRAIDEELMFHFRTLVDEQVAKGVSLAEAWDRAEVRFGSLRRYSDTCRRDARGEHPLWRVSILAAMAIIVVLGVSLRMGIRELRQEQAVLQAEVQAAQVAADSTRHSSLEPSVEPRTNRAIAGTVVDRNDRPLAEATLLVILKTWPDGQFRQENLATQSDAQGNFRLSEIIPERGQYAVLVSAIKDGFALASEYELVEKDVVADPAPIKLTLDEAVSITLVVRDVAGQPVPNARIAPASRQSSAGEEHLIYWMASEPVQMLSDAAGRVTLACFRQDDQAEIFLQLPGQDWEERGFVVDENDEIVIASIAPSF